MLQIDIWQSVNPESSLRGRVISNSSNVDVLISPVCIQELGSKIGALVRRARGVGSLNTLDVKVFKQKPAFSKFAVKMTWRCRIDIGQPCSNGKKKNRNTHG